MILCPFVGSSQLVFENAILNGFDGMQYQRKCHWLLNKTTAQSNQEMSKWRSAENGSGGLVDR
jgi:hypothetical protein